MKTFKTLVFSIAEAATVLAKHFNLGAGDSVKIEAGVAESFNAALVKLQSQNNETISELRSELIRKDDVLFATRRNCQSKSDSANQEIARLRALIPASTLNLATHSPEKLLENARVLMTETLTWARVGSCNKIAAIKAHRTLTGSGLKEAKDAVEAVMTPRY